MLAVIRKFGLGYCDLSTMMWNVSFMLRTLTINIDLIHQRSIPAIFYLLTIVAAGSYFYVYLVSMVWFVFWRCVKTGDLLAAMIIFSLGTASENGPMRLIYSMLHVEKLRKIVTTCLSCDTLVIPGSRFSRNLQKTLRKVKRRAIVFWMVIMCNGVLYLMIPFVTPGRHLIEDIFVFYGLEPMYKTPNYEIALTINIIAVLFACYSTVNVTAFVIVNAGYVEAQMLSWSEELLHLWGDAEQYYTENQTQTLSNETDDLDLDNDNKIKEVALNEFVQSRLKDIIRSHARNLNLLQQIEDVFRGALAIEFFILIIGLIAELLGGLQNTYMAVPFSFLQVAMDCLTGQRLTDAGVVFERAVFDCKWENFDRSNMKLVLLMLQSSQKAMTLSAGGMTMLNFNCLMSVVRSIYSAYTTLRSVMI